jgi:hypothetical protein
LLRLADMGLGAVLRHESLRPTPVVATLALDTRAVGLCGSTEFFAQPVTFRPCPANLNILRGAASQCGFLKILSETITFFSSPRTLTM